MQIVIEISSYDKEWITNGYYIPEEINIRISEAIAKGTPLPEGHGRLIDADKLKQRIQMADDDIMEEDWYKLYDSVISDIDNATKIIEADKEDKE